jgi:hypothetical protein
LQAFLASAADIPELSDFCLATHSFIACLLAVRVACCWWGVDAAAGLVLSLLGVGDSVVGMDVASRCDGLDAALGDVSVGVVWDWAITSPAGTMEISAANKSVLRGVMNLS